MQPATVHCRRRGTDVQATSHVNGALARSRSYARNPVMMPDDRRSLTVRLSVAAVHRRGASSRRWRSASGSSRSRSTRSSSEMAEKTTCGGCRCRRRAACCSIATARSWSRTRAPSTSRWCASRRKDLDQTLHTLALATGADEALMRETVNRRRREPSYRPIVLIENATPEQVVRGRGARHELPGIIYQQVPTRKYPASELAAHVFGYVGEVTEAQLVVRRVPRRRARRGRRPGRRRAGATTSC